MAEEAPEAIFRQRFLTALSDPTRVRFVTWEALDYPRSRRIARQDRRRRPCATSVMPSLPSSSTASCPRRLLQLALHALAAYPLAYAPITKMVTGKLPSDPKFQEEWMVFLDQLGALLAAADTDNAGS